MTEPGPPNPINRRLEADQLALGMVVRLARSGDIARLAHSAGYDFLFIDGQHGIFSLETLGHIIQAALGCGIAPLVRVRSVHDADAPVLLDGGAMGIVFPDVNTAEDARHAVNLCKFAPIGTRSVTSGYPIFNFHPIPMREAVPWLNANTTIVCMIESREGLANVEAIAAVPGVDVLLVGLTDLLADMNMPGQLGSPEAMAAVARVTRAARQHGKCAGVGGDNDLQRQGQFIADGVRFISTPSDGALLLAAGTRITTDLRAVGSKP
jgi:2-keto-3-deoxy-L-rhamnonate aldolase RhmA